MSILKTAVGLVMGAATASLTEQLEEAHRENERLRSIMRRRAEQSFACERCRDNWVRAVEDMTTGPGHL